MPALAVALDLAVVDQARHDAVEVVRLDTELLGDPGDRDPGLTTHELKGTTLAETANEIIELARISQYDLIVLPLPAESPGNPLGHLDARMTYIVQHAHCRVFLATTPVIPTEVVDTTPSARS